MPKVILLETDRGSAEELREMLQSQVQLDATVVESPEALDALLSHDGYDAILLGSSYVGEAGLETVIELARRHSDTPMLALGQGSVVVAMRRVAGEGMRSRDRFSVPKAIEQALIQDREREEQDALVERLRRMASVDSVTGVWNRAHFDELYRRETRRAERYGRCLSVAMVDIDDFKRINDTQGHQMGDRALRAMGSLLRANVRTTDIVARYGGDEFVVLMPETDETGARSVLRRVEQALTTFNGRQTFPFVLSLSIGLGTSVSGSDPLAVADRAMYEGKRAQKQRMGG